MDFCMCCSARGYFQRELDTKSLGAFSNSASHCQPFSGFGDAIRVRKKHYHESGLGASRLFDALPWGEQYGSSGVAV